jgi:predicted ester cyclase
MPHTNDQLVTLQRRITDAIDRQDWNAVKDLTAARVRIRTAGQDMDWEAWLAQGKAFYSAFSDGKHDIHETVVEADRVAIRGTWSGTHNASFNGIPATGRRVTVDMVLIDRFVDGKLVERWGVFDALALLVQIGAFPSG